MQQIKGDKIWIFIGYRVPVLMKSIFSHDATTRTFPHLSPKKRHSKVCKTIWILSDDKEGTCGFMKSKLCRTRAREEFGGSTRYLDNYRKRGRERVKVLDHRTGRDCHADRILWVSCDRSNALFYLPAIQDPENRPVYTAVYWKCSNNMLKYSRTKTSTDVCKHINAFKMIAGHGPTERSVQAAKSLRGNQDPNFKSFLISELKKLVLGATSVSHLQNLFLYLPHLHQLIHEC